MTEAYFKARSSECNKIFNDNLFRAIRENKHIIYESTGKNYPLIWLYESCNKNSFCDKLENYTIILATVLTSIEKISKQVNERTFSNIKDFMNNNTKGAPRFPSSNYNTIVKEFKKTVLDTLQKCIISYDISSNEIKTSSCGNRKIDRFVLYDNTGNKNSNLNLVLDLNNLEINKIKKILNKEQLIHNKEQLINKIEEILNKILNTQDRRNTQ